MKLVDYEKYYHSGSEFIIPRDEFEKIIEEIQRLKECCTDAYEAGQQIIKDLEKENQKLNNVLNELEKWVYQFREKHKNDTDIFGKFLTTREVLDKLKELKESDK